MATRWKKSTPNEVRLQRQSELDDVNPHRLPRRDLKDALTGSDGYGTENSAGADYARKQETSKQWNDGASVGEMMSMPLVQQTKQAGRDAASEERRESRGYKAGGMVRRGYGKARGA